jgi:DNA-binding FadR family transcriptional regulator
MAKAKTTSTQAGPVLTKEQHDDLRIRLEMLMGEYAAASQRPDAIEKLHAVLARVAPAEDAPASKDEADQNGV